ncbi:MAG: GTP-binding protein [Bdellovibrionota bacterium]
MADKIGSLLKQLGRGKNKSDFKAFAKLLSEIDELGPKALKYKELLNPKHLSLRVGITGPPGAGKSTLISEMIQHFGNNDLKIGVLAVDPSSPFSNGALLGDRIRYHEALANKNVFVRSIGSRGSPGGLSASSYLMLRAFDVYEFDVVLIETVGVGQTELEIMNVADITTVVLVPESGDGIQMMKAGLMEIADIFVVNKSDRPGAESLKEELKQEMHFQDRSGEEGDSKVEIFSTIATQKKGVEELCNFLMINLRNDELKLKRFSPEKLKAEAKSLLRADFEKKISGKITKVKVPSDLNKLF